jgi:hypothetical protein
MRAVARIISQFRSLGPYLAIELVLPGGSIVALLLWTYRNRVAARQTAARIANASHAMWACFTVALFATGMPEHAKPRCTGR